MARKTLAQTNQELEVTVNSLRVALSERASEIITLNLRVADLPKWESKVDELQLKLLDRNEDYKELETKLAAVEKESKSAKDMNKYYQDQASSADAEVEQAHAALDAVEGAPTREYEKEYGKGQRNIVTRLVGTLIAVAREGAK